MRKFKAIIFTIVLSFCLFVPFTSFADTNFSVIDMVDNLPNNSKILPDMHYVLNKDYPYQIVFVGNDNILNYDLTDYDFVLVQTASAYSGTENGYTLDLIGSDKSCNIYVSNFNDELWTPYALDISVNGLLYSADSNNSPENWDGSTLAVNAEVFDIYSGNEYSPLDYFYYMPDSDFSIVDYNGNKTLNDHVLAKIKLISHVFVNRFLKPIFDIILADTLLSIIVLTGFVVSIVSTIISIVYFIFNKKFAKKRVSR